MAWHYPFLEEYNEGAHSADEEEEVFKSRDRNEFTGCFSAQ